MSPETEDLVQTIGKYIIAAGVLLGCFVLIASYGAGNEAWTVIGLIVGWIVRDSAGQSATVNAVKTIAATNGSTPPA